jgi:N-acyl-D-aspartate/D-glutamate deacylase
MMTTAYDLVIRKGTIADGLGDEPYEGDVAIQDGKIVAVGAVHGNGQEEIDAAGKLITPGFVDIHTHYDAQVTWDHSLVPSSNQGVTTVVMGNCGIGFAPCRPSDRELLMYLMEGVEDIPLASMREGLPWDWESFPEFLDALARRECDVDFATQVPHSAVRVYAMGERAANREPATTADIQTMVAIVQDAMRAGALGFTTSRTLLHRTRDGGLTPEISASEEELQAIAAGMDALGTGVLEFNDDFHLTSEAGSVEFAMWRRIGAASHRPISFTLVQFPRLPDDWRYLLKFAEQANDAGVTMRPQVSSRAVGSFYGLDVSEHPFMFAPSYVAIAGLPLAERVAAMKRPEVRASIIAEAPLHPLRGNRVIANMYALGDPCEYEPSREHSMGARAERSGRSELEEAYDAMLADDGRAMLYYPASNFVDGTLDVALEMMLHRDTIIGIGDGGAHVARICDSSIPSHVLAHWTRDRAGDRLPVGGAVRMLTYDTAQAVGLGDRGRVAPGMVADLNVIDYDRLRLRAPVVRHDLPAGGTRLLQTVEGYVATVKSGTVTFRDGVSTGAFPGKLLRGARPAPTQ